MNGDSNSSTPALEPMHGPASEAASEPATLRELVESTVVRLGEVERGTAGSLVAFERSGQSFAFLAGQTVEVRLEPVVAAAAMRTPDTGQSERGIGWVAFTPATLDRFARDRIVAWLEHAWRRAGDCR